MTNTTEAATTKFWPYKYDTTSVGMRAVAEHLSLDRWPRCVIYTEQCDETNGLPLASVFSMIDSLVDGVALRQAPVSIDLRRRSHSPSAFTLRANVEWRDHVPHYALPWFFKTTIRRTVHVLHYPPHSRAAICGDTTASHRPYSCDQMWTNAQRFDCGNAVMDAACRASPPRIWEPIPERQAHLARAYPNHTIDFVILDAMDDYQ